MLSNEARAMLSQEDRALIAASESIPNQQAAAEPEFAETKSANESSGAKPSTSESQPKSRPGKLAEFDHRKSGSSLNDVTLPLQLASAQEIQSQKQGKYLKKTTSLYVPGLFARSREFYEMKLKMHIQKYEALRLAGELLEAKSAGTLSIVDIKQDLPLATQGFHSKTEKLLDKVDEYLHPKCT